MQTGGDIQSNTAYAHIISIGYEIETSSLAKLSVIRDDEDRIALLNTDTARKDLDKLLGKASDVTFENEEEEENYQLRENEMIVLPAYDDDHHIDKDVSFLATNDITTSRFVKRLSSLCDNEMDKDDLYTLETTVPLELDKKKHGRKGSVQTVGSLTENVYQIKFVSWDDTGCETFTDVEWIMTYYRPKQNNPNIILDTFLNAVRNLILHLRDLKPMDARLTMTTDYTGKITIGHPEKRILYHKPHTNLYYLQTHWETEAVEGHDFNLDDVCTSIQMTFASPIQHTFSIMKELMTDRIRSIKSLAEKSDKRLQILSSVETCVLLLFQEYNQSRVGFSEDYPILNTAENAELFLEISGYLSLILLKLTIYFNAYLQKEKKRNLEKKEKAGSTSKKPDELPDPNEKINYFKNSLFFNCRHSNYALYVALKASMRKLLAPNFEIMRSKKQKRGSAVELDEDRIVAKVFRQIVLNPPVLLEYLVVDPSYIRKNGFSPTNVLDKKSAGYGDPVKSLHSYFSFFENPIDTDSNRALSDNSIISYDWFQYKGIDVYSSTQDINDGIVLVECRSFYNMLSSFAYKIGDRKVKQNMRTGICNMLNRYSQSDIPIISIGNLKRILAIARPKGEPDRDQTRRTRIRLRRLTRKREKHGAK